MTCPYLFYLVDFFHRSTEHSFIVFGFVYISSHICSHILKLENNVITKPFHEAFRKCIQLLYSDQVPSHQQAMLDQKRSKFEPKGPTMGRAKFFRTVNLDFQKEGHKISFYTKNQQNSTKHLEHISQNFDFGPKRSKFGPKMAENGQG